MLENLLAETRTLPEVIVPTFCIISCLTQIVRCGAVPVLVPCT